MSRKLSSTLIRQAANLVKTGSTLKEAAIEIGCSADVLSVKLRGMGIDTSVGKRRGAMSQIKRLPEQELIALYLEGAGAPALARKYNCSTAAIGSCLQRNNVPLRGINEANKLVAVRKTTEQHVAGVQNARTVRTTNMIKAATTGIPSHSVTRTEIVLGDLLTANGFNPKRQVIVDGYLIDIAIDQIAVEVKTGNVPASTELSSARSKKIIESGYSFVFVAVTDVGSIWRHEDDLISAFKKLRADPPTGREYWMIRCTLNDLGPDYEQDQWSIIKCTPKGPTAIS